MKKRTMKKTIVKQLIIRMISEIKTCQIIYIFLWSVNDFLSVSVGKGYLSMIAPDDDELCLGEKEKKLDVVLGNYIENLKNLTLNKLGFFYDLNAVYCKNDNVFDFTYILNVVSWGRMNYF